ALRSSSMPEPRDPLLKVVYSSGIKAFIKVTYISKSLCNNTFCPEASGQRFTGVWSKDVHLQSQHNPKHSLMIPPLVHQRRPCYDFYFL
ncbi:hypothetical protein, partial [Vibrio vulnificus]|uniref:hypothetical protein n=1 Tax=Vibrio vulnificus TaxID=672 RepID=UPI0032EE77A9